MHDFRRMLRKVLSFLNFTSGAALGIVLYPLVRLYKLMESALIYTSIAAVLIPLVAFIAGAGMHSQFQVGFFGAAATTILTAGALVGLFLGIMPLILVLAAVRTILTAPLEGLNTGWNEGVYSVLSNVFGKLFGTRPARLPRPGNGLVPEDPALFGIMGMDMNTILLLLGQRTATAAARPGSDEAFNALALSEPDVALLQASQRPRLTPIELNQLADADDVTVELEAYMNLLSRLDADVCPILLDRPAREVTTVLAKQYKNGEQWLPVSGVSHIFDKESIKQSFLVNALHPVSRDLISTPSPHIIGHVEHVTRYITHPYYVADGQADSHGMSQEINLLTVKLRDRLLRMQELPNAGEPPVELASVNFGV